MNTLRPWPIDFLVLATGFFSFFASSELMRCADARVEPAVELSKTASAQIPQGFTTLEATKCGRSCQHGRFVLSFSTIRANMLLRNRGNPSIIVSPPLDP